MAPLKAPTLSDEVAGYSASLPRYLASFIQERELAGDREINGEDQLWAPDPGCRIELEGRASVSHTGADYSRLTRDGR